MNKQELRELAVLVSASSPHFLTSDIVSRLGDVLSEHITLIINALALLSSMMQSEKEAEKDSNISSNDEDVYYHEGRSEAYGLVVALLEKLLEEYL